MKSTDSPFDRILLFTDGACSGNPGRGGWGAVIAYPEGEVEELGEGHFSTTNNRMELLAIIKGLDRLAGRPEPIWVLTDSTYAINGITKWIWGWRKRGWTTAEGKEVLNKDLWLSLSDKLKNCSTVNWKYLRGHSGHPGNERCDEIAVAFTKGKSIDLYNGSLLQYPVAIMDLPEDMSLPPPKPQSHQKKKKAHSYLSYVNGVLTRHKTWSECEATVKGRSGAKFKKTTSAEDESQIIKSWGLREDALKD